MPENPVGRRPYLPGDPPPGSGPICCLKLGKLAPQRSVSTPAFGDYIDKATTWPAVVAQGWEYAPNLGPMEMLANDLYGDCAEAGAAHLIQAQTANAGNPLHATTKQVLDLYSDLTGFKQDDPETDQGTCLIDLLRFWKNTGITVTNAQGHAVVHKIKGWASLDLSSIAQVRYANYLFGGTYLGIQCPQSAMDDMSNWKYNPKSPNRGGHCVTGVGQGAAGGHVISWGRSIPFTWEFFLHKADEGYVVVSEAWLNTQGKSPSGMDLYGLLAAMKAL
jgi:hypothetical protein